MLRTSGPFSFRFLRSGRPPTSSSSHSRRSYSRARLDYACVITRLRIDSPMACPSFAPFHPQETRPSVTLRWRRTWGGGEEARDRGWLTRPTFTSHRRSVALRKCLRPGLDDSHPPPKESDSTRTGGTLAETAGIFRSLAPANFLRTVSRR